MSTLRVSSGGSALTIIPHVQATYEPQPDITAYELALILPYLMGRPLMEGDWTSLGTAQRHLKREVPA